MAPTSIASQQRQRGPKSATRSDGKMIVIKRRELIGSVLNSQVFAVTKYAVNPGLASTFPLLSVQAPQWEQYRFRKLAFEYITRTATTTVGSVIMAPDYDPEDATPTTESQVTGYNGAVEDAPWKNITCFIDPNSVSPGPRKFIRTGSIAGDIKNYDALNFFLATNDGANANGIGKLWVDYEVELSIPQNSPSDILGPSRVSVFRRAAAQGYATTVNESIAFDQAAPGYDPLGIGIVATGVFTPPKGVYKLEFQSSFQNDSAAPDATTVIMDIFKNGASISAHSHIYYGADNDYISFLSGQGVVACNGTDTVEIMVNMTGTGTLTSIANTGSVIWSVV